jgi:hypothetical protein
MNATKDNGIVNIHGKNYMTVAKRVELAHQEKVLDGVVTEVLSHDPIVIKAVVTIKGKQYTGISAVDKNSQRMIEKSNPYEVAETSAVGRALGFAGYGIGEGIASADEIARTPAESTPAPATDKPAGTNGLACEICGAPATDKRGTTKGGKPWHGVFCSTENKLHTRWLSN